MCSNVWKVLQQVENGMSFGQPWSSYAFIMEAICSKVLISDILTAGRIFVLSLQNFQNKPEQNYSQKKPDKPKNDYLNAH